MSLISNVTFIGEYEKLNTEKKQIEAEIKLLQERLNCINYQLTKFDVPCR